MISEIVESSATSAVLDSPVLMLSVQLNVLLDLYVPSPFSATLGIDIDVSFQGLQAAQQVCRDITSDKNNCGVVGFVWCVVSLATKGVLLMRCVSVLGSLESQLASIVNVFSLVIPGSRRLLVLLLLDVRGLLPRTTYASRFFDDRLRH